MEDKAKITKALGEVLKMTRRFDDLISLTYEQDPNDECHETVTAVFPGGTVECNVSIDSGIALISDVIAQLRKNA